MSAVLTAPVLKVLAAWLSAIVLLGAAFIGTVATLNARLYSPEHQVGLYLEALREGDGGEALGLSGAVVPEDTDGTLLDGEALRRSTAALTDVRIGEPEDTGAETVDVPVSFMLNGAEGATEFPLRRTGRSWGVLDEWRFEPIVLPAVGLSAPMSTEAEVNGTDVGLPGGRTSLAAFYPGSVTARYESRYLTAPDQTAAVVGSEPSAELALTMEPTPELAQAVDEQLNAFLDGCADQAVFLPANCPFAYPTNDRLAGTIDWSITEYPTAAITSEGDGTWQLAPLQGSALIETQLLNFFSGAVREVSEPVPFEFDAGLTVTEDAVTVTPVVSY